MALHNVFSPVCDCLDTFRPILLSPRYVPDVEILADGTGNPILDHQLFLLDCRLPKEEINEQYPTLGDYLREGRERGYRTGTYAYTDPPGMLKSVAWLRRSYTPTSVVATRRTGGHFGSS